MMNEYSAISPSRNDQWSGKTLLSSRRSGVAAWNRSSSCSPVAAGSLARSILRRRLDVCSLIHGRSQKPGPTGSR